MTEQLKRKVEAAIKFLQVYAKGCGGTLELAYSGGKDSDVILTLARMAGIEVRPIYKCTTIDPPGTIRHVIDNGVEIVRPQRPFFKIIEQKGFPSRFARFCCSELKEYKIEEHTILGVRRAESKARMKRYKEPTRCRVYSKNERVEQIFPILDWTDEDVAEFITAYHVQLAPHYYDADGNPDFSRRLGCMGCPLANRRQRVEEFRAHPKLVRAWIRAGKVFWDSHPNSKVRIWFTDIYECFYVNVFIHSIKDHVFNRESLFPVDYKQFLENYFNVELP